MSNHGYNICDISGRIFFVSRLRSAQSDPAISCFFLFKLPAVHLLASRFARNVRSVLFRALHVILIDVVFVVIKARAAGMELFEETTSQGGWNGEFPPHVEQNVRLTFSDSVGSCGPHRAVVKMEPLAVMHGKGSVMSSTSTVTHDFTI